MRTTNEVSVTTQTPGRKSCIEHLIPRAYFLAQLLTGSPELAESVVLESVDSWDRDAAAEELMKSVLLSASRVESPTGESEARGLPPELEEVVKLPSALRRCFVLRFLAGLSAEACARMLNFHPGAVEQCAGDALKRLASLRFTIGTMHWALHEGSPAAALS